MEVQRLEVKHYDELLALLNYVFSRKNKREMNFEKEMPKMCIRDDENMGKHLGIFEGDKLVACMGVYPFEVVVAGETLRFATTGNVAVHPDCEGKGYMGKMMNAAMKELDRLDIDIARLGGLRSRYNRYGFESCGQNFIFTFTEKNRQRKFPDFKNDITFMRINADDKDALAFVTSLYNKNKIAVPRIVDNAYLSLTMWLNTPYLAMRDGVPVGYICANEDKNDIAEFDAVDLSALTDMICAWQEYADCNITFSRQMHQVDSVRIFSEVCEGYSAHSPSHFKIINWEKAVDMFFKLKSTYCSVMPGEFRIEIEGYGTLLLFSKGEEVGCRLCSDNPDITLDAITATRYIFGSYSPVYTAYAPPVLQAWFPLPLSWNGQDRV